MTWRYWDYSNNSTASGSSYWPSAYTNSTSSTTTTFYTNSARAFSTGTYWVSMPVVRQYLVIEPECWTDQIAADFVRLVNDEVRTGFKVTMRMRGQIDITDPDVEVREMKNFVPLLKNCASAEDKKKIDNFFAAHPCDPPAPEAA